MALAVGAGLGAAPAAQASPLTMTWSVQPNWDGNHRYTFRLTLDNHDGSWQTGQGFGWIIFGDGGASPSQLNDFVAEQSGFPAGPWTTTTKTAGARNGPTLSFGRTVWKPTAIGQSVTWSGTSASLVAFDRMKWSSLVVSGGAQRAELLGAVQIAACNADINGDGFVDGIDADLFNNAFGLGSIGADYNHDGFVDGIDSDLFNNDFEAGCD